MSNETKITPSARASSRIMALVADFMDRKTRHLSACEIAAIIDEETGAADLYAALEEAREDLYHFGISAGHSLGCVTAEKNARELHAKIDAALKKARGES
jgi:hypothetical protein